MHVAAGESKEAIVELSLAAQDAIGVGDIDRAMQCYAAVGSLHRRLGDYGAAVTCHQRRLEMAQESGAPQAICEAQCALAHTYYRQAQAASAVECESEETAGLAEAAHHYGSAKALAQALHNRTQLARVYRGLGQVALAQQEPAAAVDFLSKHLQAVRAVGTKEQLATGCLALYKASRVYHGWDDTQIFSGATKKDFDGLVALLWERAAALQSLARLGPLAETYVELGRLYEESGSLSAYHGTRKARELYIKAMDICKAQPLSELGPQGAATAAEATRRLSALEEAGCVLQ